MLHSSLAYVLTGSLVAHLIITAVMSVFARHKVQYLSIAWVTGIFAVALACVIPFSGLIEVESKHPAMLHPGTLVGLMGWSYLQSIYPLGITMPGYLQWKRMWGYASPVLILIVLYVVMTLIGVTSPNYYTWQELSDNFFTADMFMRIAMLAVSVYYIINILRLPRTMLRFPDVPRYLSAYATLLGLSSCLYLWVILRFTILNFEIWLIVFTLANLYICFRSLETIAISLPMPVITEVQTEPKEKQDEPDNLEDFNETNLHLFKRIEYWMQHHRNEWKDNTFGRDQLCEGVGINRHLILQCVRSQGYYNIHEYINTYRITELKRMIARGEATNLRECLDAGFGTVKTARTCFEKITGGTLDEYLNHFKEKE